VNCHHRIDLVLGDPSFWELKKTHNDRGFSLTMDRQNRGLIYDDCAEQNIRPDDVWKRAHKASHGYPITGLFGMNFRDDAPNRDDSADDREISNNSIGDGIHEIRELKFSDRIDAQEARQDQYRRNESSKALDGQRNPGRIFR
jgi:hypothetical protein